MYLVQCDQASHFTIVQFPSTFDLLEGSNPPRASIPLYPANGSICSPSEVLSNLKSFGRVGRTPMGKVPLVFNDLEFERSDLECVGRYISVFLEGYEQRMKRRRGGVNLGLRLFSVMLAGSCLSGYCLFRGWPLIYQPHPELCRRKKCIGTPIILGTTDIIFISSKRLYRSRLRSTDPVFFFLFHFPLCINSVDTNQPCTRPDRNTFLTDAWSYFGKIPGM